MQSYLELPLYLLSGLLGSGHCLGMCGPFAIAIGLHDRSKGQALLKQGAYSAGRCFTYGSVGALLGGIGKKLAQEFAYVGNVGALIAVVAGIFIAYFGIAGLTGFSLTRLLRRSRANQPLRNNRKITSAFPRPSGSTLQGVPPEKAEVKKGAVLRPSCGSFSLFSSFFKQGAGSMTGALLAGLATGFLPCGLLYGMLSIAAASQSVTRGAAMMILFGLGTSPALMALGVLGRSITLQWRGWLYKAAAVSLIAAGALTCVRGVYALEAFAAKEKVSACPFCAAK